MQRLKNVRRLLEKQRWVLLCAAVLTAAAFTVSLVALYAPREPEPPLETEAEPAETAAASAPPPTAAPRPSPTAMPVITPPAQSAASGSDVILSHVPSSSGSDLSAGADAALDAEG